MIDPELFGPGDFVQVRAALVREVGLTDAVVLARIHFRAREDYRRAYGDEDVWWWRAPHTVIAEETGLTEKQVRAALDRLREAGHVVAEQHHREGPYDRAYSYRVPIWEMHVPSGADAHVPAGADDLPLQDLLPFGEKNPPEVSRAESEFEVLWAAWPRKANRAGSLRMWLKLSDALQRHALPSLLRHAEAYATAVAQGMEPTSVPHLQTMVNPANARWGDEPIQWRPRRKETPTDRATAAMGSMLGGPPAGPFPARTLPPLGSAHLHMEIES